MCLHPYHNVSMQNKPLIKSVVLVLANGISSELFKTHPVRFVGTIRGQTTSNVFCSQPAYSTGSVSTVHCPVVSSCGGLAWCGDLPGLNKFPNTHKHRLLFTGSLPQPEAAWRPCDGDWAECPGQTRWVLSGFGVWCIQHQRAPT